MPLSRTHNLFPRRAGASRSGFTLIELLVVMFILAILIAFAVGVYNYVMNKSKRNQTIATQKILMAAIHAYRNAQGDWPMVDPVDDHTPSERNRRLYQQLNMEPKAREIIAKLPSSAILVSALGGGGRFLDAWGTEMDYSDAGGFGGTPVLISAGPDQRLLPTEVAPGQAQDSDADKDNVRSDGRGQ